MGSSNVLFVGGPMHGRIHAILDQSAPVTYPSFPGETPEQHTYTPMRNLGLDDLPFGIYEHQSLLTGNRRMNEIKDKIEQLSREYNDLVYRFGPPRSEDALDPCLI